VTTVQGPKMGYFFWKVSSEPGYDKLTFSIDGNEMDTISGEMPWDYRFAYIPSGTHTLGWYYSKDVGTDGGQDKAWVDRLILYSWVERTISGHVRNSVGDPVSGVKMSVTSDYPKGTHIHCDPTDSSGIYHCKVPHGWKGRITPSKKWMSFTPNNYSFTESVTYSTASADFICHPAWGIGYCTSN